MDEMKELFINASKSYTVRIQENADGLSSFIKPLLKGKKLLLITDERVEKLYAEQIVSALIGVEITQIVLPEGEAQKNGENYFKILNTLAENGFTRSDAILTLGGGVVGDLGGFAACSYMRGIVWINLPTTVLAAVDAAIGGKTAINLSVGKNLCGSFYQPDGVVICTDFFKTLSDRDLLSGYGEILKYALLSKTVNEKALDEGLTEELIFQCLSIKKSVVEEDEREQGKRKILNLGHTVGHAIEALSGYTLSHGECVVKGLYAALKISKKLYSLDEKTSGNILKIITKKGHDLTIPYSPKEIVEGIKADKKRTRDRVDFILLKGVGEPVITPIGLREIEEALS